MATLVVTMSDTITVEVTRECPLFEIDFEEGDVSDFTSTVDPDGEDIHANTGHALAGTFYGGELTVDDNDVFYGEYKINPALNTGVFRIRFYIDPSDLDMINGDDFVFLALYNSSNQIFAQMHMNYNGATDNASLGLYNDAGVETVTSNYQIVNYIEFKIVKESVDGLADGSGQLWINGIDKETISSVENYARFADFWYIRIGMISGRDAGTEGHFVVDEIVANLTGTLIGAR